MDPVICMPGSFWVSCLGGPTFRYLCVETARAVARGTSTVGRVRMPGGAGMSRFGSSERMGGFTWERPFFVGRPVRNAPEGNQVVSSFSV